MSSEPIFQDLTQELYEPASTESRTDQRITALTKLVFDLREDLRDLQKDAIIRHVATSERLDAVVKGVNEIGSMMDWTVKTVSEVAAAFQNAYIEGDAGVK